MTATRATVPPVDTRGVVGSVEDLQRENEQLRTALVTRIVIEQAKGMVAERLQVEIEVAFELLRREARNRRMRVHTLAAAVVAREPWADMVFPPGSTGDPR